MDNTDVEKAGGRNPPEPVDRKHESPSLSPLPPRPFPWPPKQSKAKPDDGGPHAWLYQRVGDLLACTAQLEGLIKAAAETANRDATNSYNHFDVVKHRLAELEEHYVEHERSLRALTTKLDALGRAHAGNGRDTG